MRRQTRLTAYYASKRKKIRKPSSSSSSSTAAAAAINFRQRGISRHARIQNLFIQHVRRTSDLRTAALRVSAVKSLLQKIRGIVEKHCGGDKKVDHPCHVFKEVSFFYDRTKRCDLVLYVPDARLLFLIEIKTTSNRKIYDTSTWRKQLACTFHQAVMSICRSSSCVASSLRVYSLLTTRLYHVDRARWKHNEDATKIAHSTVIPAMPSVKWLKTNSL